MVTVLKTVCNKWAHYCTHISISLFTIDACCKVEEFDDHNICLISFAYGDVVRGLCVIFVRAAFW